MELGIGIKVDPADSAAKADAVTTALHKTEDRGAQLAKQLQGVAGSFKSLSSAIGQHQAALERTSAVHGRLTSTTHAAGQAFGKMAEAIQREQRMLETIHGPARRYAEDLQALDSLLHRNVISTGQYADQVKRLNHEIDGVPKQPSVGAYKVSKLGMPSMGGMGGLAAAAGGVLGGRAALGGLDDFQNMENRLRYLAGGDVQKVNDLFKQLQGVSERTRQSLGATTETFVKVSTATKQMGLSTGDTMQFMERLNKAVALSGASTSAASAGLMQLSQALSAGALRGEEYNSIVEQIPVVADTIQQSLGITRGELRKMANEGKITADVIVTSFQKAGDSLDKDFGNTLPTVGQHWVMFKDKITLAIGEMNEATDVAGKLGAALVYVGNSLSMSSLKSGKGGLFDVTNVLTFGQAQRNLEERTTREANESAKFLDVMSELTSQTDEWGNLVSVATQAQDDWNTATSTFRGLSFERTLDGLIGKLPAVAKATRAQRQEVDEYARTLAMIHGPKDQAIKQLSVLGQLHMNGAISLAEYNNATAKHRDLLLELDVIRAKSVTNGIEVVDYTRGVQTPDAPTQSPFDMERFRQNMALARGGIAEMNQALKDIELEKTRERFESLGATIRPVADSLIDMFKQGEFSAKQLSSTLKDVAIEMLRMSALRAIGSGGGSGAMFMRGLLGGANGFDHVVGPGRGFELPGFATGGRVTVGGIGGTDSKIAAFRVTPGESIEVRTPQQQAAQAAWGSQAHRAMNDSARSARDDDGPPTVNVIMDPRDIIDSMGTRRGRRVIAQIDRDQVRRRMR